MSNLMLLAVFRDNLQIEVVRFRSGMTQTGRFRRSPSRVEAARAFSLLALRDRSEQRRLPTNNRSQAPSGSRVGVWLREMTVAEDVPEILLYPVPLGGVTECVVEWHLTNVAWSIDLSGFTRYLYPASAAGAVKKNADPTPGSDSTRILPPYRSTIRLQIARPNPVPLRLSSLCSRLNSAKIWT